MNLSIIERIREIAALAAIEYNLELVQAQVAGTTRKFVITVFIDKPGGVTHEDCAKVSRKIDAVLDAEDFIPSAFLLEVSSPGLERELYNRADFEKFTGSLAKVKTATPINGQKNFRGRIKRVEDNDILFDDKTCGMVRFPHSVVVKANLEIDLDEELKKGENRRTESGK